MLARLRGRMHRIFPRSLPWTPRGWSSARLLVAGEADSRHPRRAVPATGLRPRSAVAAVTVDLHQRPDASAIASRLRPLLASVALHSRSPWHAHEISRQQAKPLRTTSLKVSRNALVPPQEKFS